MRVAKEELRLFFNDGFLIFGRPVSGTRLVAVFSAEDELGDAEIMLMAPNRGERQSLAAFTKSPNLNEHFRSGLVIATEGSLDRLYESLSKKPDVAKAPEMGALLEEKWGPVARNLTGSFGVRVLDDLLSAERSSRGILFAALAGRELGNFDTLYDPRLKESILAGKLGERNGRPFYHIWTSFPSRSSRTGAAAQDAPFVARHYRIDAAFDSNLHLRVTTRVQVQVGALPLRSFPFEISPRMKINSARVDGKPAEIYTGQSVRDSAARGTENEAFLVVTGEAAAAGSEHEVEFDHEGDVVLSAGNKVYYVSSRGTWYPQRGGFATYDVTFRYPKHLTLVTAGEGSEERTEGDVKITRRALTTPIRLAGFNLGDYNKVSTSRAGVTIEVYGNRTVETALQPRPRQIFVFPPALPSAPGRPAQRRQPELISATPVTPDPATRLETLAGDIGSALEYMSGQFGPPALKTLTVSPIPGTFGQGFPGLIYLSTVAYLNPQERPASLRDSRQQLFFSEILQAHETAHQWWGNVVASAHYQDDWLLESLANYSALMFIEKKKGSNVLDSILEDYRNHLLSKDGNGKTVESAGPIVWGVRLESIASTEAWRSITYEKGSWILHMLRKRMGDDRFAKFLGELRRRFEWKSVSTEEFRLVAAEFLPPKSSDPKLETFFENWVHATGVPTLKVKFSIRGTAPNLRVTGTIAQTGVDDDFTIEAPVEIQFARGASQIVWVRTASEPVPFTAAVRQRPTKVSVLAGGVLAR